MSTLNLNAPASKTVTQLFGVDVSILTDDHLIKAASQLKVVLDNHVKASEGLESKKLYQQTKSLEDGLKAIVSVLDDENREKPQQQSGMVPSFDFEAPALEEKKQVFGVFVNDLTESGLKNAMTELSSIIKADIETNKAFNSSKIAKDIEENEKSLNLLVKMYDSLDTSKD